MRAQMRPSRVVRLSSSCECGSARLHASVTKLDRRVVSVARCCEGLIGLALQATVPRQRSAPPPQRLAAGGQDMEARALTKDGVRQRAQLAACSHSGKRLCSLDLVMARVSWASVCRAVAYVRFSVGKGARSPVQGGLWHVRVVTAVPLHKEGGANEVSAREVSRNVGGVRRLVLVLGHLRVR